MALDDLGLDYLWVLSPRDEAHALDGRISVHPAARIAGLAGQVAA
ncbi:MAG: hypothetical protein OXF68_06735 [Gammaproteobacteria bacterium]|nr:hypothetical protein [Gammaproteobacteria bacterium]